MVQFLSFGQPVLPWGHRWLRPTAGISPLRFQPTTATLGSARIFELCRQKNNSKIVLRMCLSHTNPPRPRRALSWQRGGEDHRDSRDQKQGRSPDSHTTTREYLERGFPPMA